MEAVVFLEIQGMKASTWRVNFTQMLNFASATNKELADTKLSVTDLRLPGMAMAREDKDVSVKLNTQALNKNTWALAICTAITAAIFAGGLITDPNGHPGFECSINTSNGIRTLKVQQNISLTTDLIKACIKDEIPEKIIVRFNVPRKPQR